MSIPLPQQAQLRLLGPVLLESVTGSTSTPPGPRAKSLVIALALAPGRTLSPEQLIDDVWGLDAPASSKTALHTLISRTRSFAPELLASSAGGYRLTAPRSSVDLWQAEQLQHEALKYLDADPAKAAELASNALELWTGDPASDASPSPAVEELRRQAWRLQTELSELHGQALLNSGQPVAAIEVLRPLAEAEPLSRFEVFRRALRNELGSSPSPAAAALKATLLTADSPDSSEAKASAEPKPGRQFLSGLRAAPNELLGRESDIVGLEQVMATSRVTTVLGPGGLGKTRLAMEIAQRQANAGLPSVIVVELASVRDGEDIWLALASALGITEPRQKPTSLPVDIRRRIVETLLERRTLLFMDNCEHVIEAAAAVIAELIASVPRLNVLTTSRAPLEIAGERVYPLQALATEASDGAPAAISLFLERATAARPSAALPADTVAALCARLDGLPMAIELAAARVRTMNVEEILSRISERFSMMTVLRGTDRTAPERPYPACRDRLELELAG